MLFIFDLDDTIYNYMDPFANTIKELLAIDDPDQCWELYQSYRRFSDQVFPMSQSRTISLQEAGYLRTKLMAEFHHLDMDEPTIRKFHETYLYWQQHIVIQPLMKEIFGKLKQTDHKLAIITNGPGAHQERKIAALNLDEYFDPHHIFISGHYGFDKPDHRIFDIAISRLQPKKDAVYYIGDNYHADVVGAKNAGLKAIWLKIRDYPEQPTKTIEADHTVASYQELKALVDSLIGG